MAGVSVPAGVHQSEYGEIATTRGRTGSRKLYIRIMCTCDPIGAVSLAIPNPDGVPLGGLVSGIEVEIGLRGVPYPANA